MGIAASQGVLFLLTARGHDLTYRGNNIAQQRLLLAGSLENVSKAYAQKTGDRQMTVTLRASTGTNSVATKNLSYQSLMQLAAQTNQSSMRISSADGQKAYVRPGTYEGADGGRIVISMSGSTATEVKTDAEGREVSRLTYQATNLSGLQDLTEENNYLQEGLRNGTFVIQEYKAKAGEDTQSWQSTPWSSMASINDNLYTDNDARAKGEYDAASTRIQQQDKRLEVEQKQVETDYKAVSSQQEAVQKLVQGNVEKGFKLFS